MTVAIFPYTVVHFHASDGSLLNGGLLFTYAGGTTTKLATYTNSGGGTPNSNPIVLNSRGEPTGSVGIWLTAATDYKFVLSNPGDTDPPTNPIWTQDNIRGV